MCKPLKEGQWIKYESIFPYIKIHRVEIACVDLKESHYCVYAEYGQDKIPFDKATLIDKPK